MAPARAGWLRTLGPSRSLTGLADCCGRSAALIAAQLARTAALSLASAPANTWGWRRISLALRPRAIASRSKRPASLAIWACSTTCSSRSPSSSLR